MLTLAIFFLTFKDYDNIESKSFAIDTGRVAIWSTLQRTIQEFSIQARNRHIDLVMEIKDACGNNIDANETKQSDILHLLVLGDSARLSQVFRNLVSNALKFTPEHKRVLVTATYSPDGLPDATPDDIVEMPMSLEFQEAGLTSGNTRKGSVVIQVTDEGVGLTSEQIKLMFREGVQFNANVLQAGGGSGLGLCIAKEIVEMHHGRIMVESNGLGCGTTFQVELPLYESPQVKQEKNRAQTEATSSKSSTDGRLILVVDDVLTNTKMLVRLLERAGHQCLTAKNGEEAIAVYKTHQAAINCGETSTAIDTILIDFEMPLMNGPDATQHLREMGCSAYIFGVTGNILIEDVMTFKKSGADMVIFKPINLLAIDEAWAKMETTMSDRVSDRSARILRDR